MIKHVNDISEAKYILDHLRDEDRAELAAYYGKNWYDKTLKTVCSSDFLVLYGQNENRKTVPIAMGGVYELPQTTDNIGCVWMISSHFIKMNKYLFLKEFKNQIGIAKNKYNILYNFIYKENFVMKNLLKRMGFEFDNPHPKDFDTKPDFEFFYFIKNHN